VDGQPVDVKNGVAYRTLQAIKSMKEINFFSGSTATAIYGSRAASGVVTVVTGN
jgi:hypothetical protein